MVCEGILKLCDTISEEIIERTRKEDAAYYLPQIDYLKSLLEQHNIPFHLDNETAISHTKTVPAASPESPLPDPGSSAG